jgi:catechol 2,3-dioxygenase-like lactoylglutathione lyase family enzyme
MFKKLGAVVLFVQDFEKSLVFYRDTLGLEVVDLGEQFAAFRMEGHNFALNGLPEAAKMVNLPVDAFEPQSGKADRAMLCAEVPNVDEAYEALKAKGVEFSQPPEDKYWGLRCAYFSDPEGNIWEFYHPLGARIESPVM